MSNFLIKEMSESDWCEYRSIRLESLRDSPDSFASTYQREASFTDEQWRKRLRVPPDIHSALALAAIENQSFIGLLSCVLTAPETRCAHLYQMWVSPEYRGMGVGRSLVDRAISWAATRATGYIQLSVTTINADAISLYTALGFSPTGHTEPLREGSDLISQTMQMKMPPA